MKILSFLFCIMLSVTANAQQVFSHITKLDKFDDTVWTRDSKTIITRTDSTIVIETKGKEPEVYWYVDYPLVSDHSGSKDKLENLVDDIWGFEDTYWVVNFKERETFLQTLTSLAEKFAALEQEGVRDTEEGDKNFRLHLIEDFLKIRSEMTSITFRYISYSKYYWEYKNNLIWVTYPNKDRIIYK